MTESEQRWDWYGDDAAPRSGFIGPAALSWPQPLMPVNILSLLKPLTEDRDDAPFPPNHVDDELPLPVS